MNIFLSTVGSLCIIGAIVLGIILFIKSNKKSTKEKLKLPIIIGVIGLITIILSSSFVIIPTGFTGVRTTFGQVSDKSVPKGFNLKIPFAQQIELVNNKQQDITIDLQVWGETSEKTPVYAKDTVVTYQILENKSPWVFANVTNHNTLIDEKIVSSAIKAAMVELSVSNVTNRTTIEPLVKDKLNDSLVEKYGEDTVIVKKVVINDMDFEPEYNAAIAEKSIALQNKQTQEIANETAIAKAEADKKVAIAKAQATAESTKIKAEAEAEANKTISQSLTDEIIKNKAIDKWDGKLPIVSGSDANITDVSSLLGQE